MASNCSRMIEVDKLVFADNVRSPECMQIPAMIESFRRAGQFKPNHPLVLSEKPDGTYLVLNGNRRGTGLVWLRDNDAEAYQQILPSGKVPAIVHKGLTLEEEANLRIDHAPDEDRVPLDDWSIFLAIKQLVKIGVDSQERMAIKLGLYIANGKKKGQPNRSYVQTRVNLARLPAFIQDEIRKLTLDKDSTLIRWAQVASLYKVYNKEYTSYPDCDGPEFSALWKKITTPPEATETDEAGTRLDPKELSPADAIKRSQSASSKGLKQALLCVTRQSASDLAEIDARFVEAESALATLTDVKAYLGEKDFAELVDAATKQGNDRRQVEAEAEIDAKTAVEADQVEAEYAHPVEA